MTQLTLEFNTGSSIQQLSKHTVQDNFVIEKVYDRFMNSETLALKHVADNPEIPIRINYYIIPNNSFCSSGYLYLDLVHYKDSIAQAKEKYSEGSNLSIYCYINMSNSFIISNLHKNLKTIILGYYVNNETFRKVPNPTEEFPTWAQFDPSVNMHMIKVDFVLHVEHDYTGLSTCYYRTSGGSKNPSISYKYANKSTSNICGHETIEADAVRRGALSLCHFDTPSSILLCPFYKEDKFRILTIELYHKDAPTTTIFKVIDSYLIRSITEEVYSIVFEETSLDTGKKSIIKQFSYNDLSFETNDEREKLVEEVRLQAKTILSDYTTHYAHRIVSHVESAQDLKKRSQIAVKASYISNLISQP